MIYRLLCKIFGHKWVHTSTNKQAYQEVIISGSDYAKSPIKIPSSIFDGLSYECKRCGKYNLVFKLSEEQV